ncbi:MULTISPECIES: hypothetical protein [unclassified Phenylobacterium]|uniref:hypothetical protein n=1 Tax=unclassified Phenylobacterium TaxID=2640670 RepID=UPI00083B5451|nr:MULTISPECIES: hypothetical protein [unclassified Phenylobacterium]
MLRRYRTWFASRLRLPTGARFGLGRAVIPGPRPPGAPRWREDAIYFLELNIQEMIVAPYMSTGPPSRQLLRQTPLWQPLLDDIHTIVARAETIAMSRGRTYVSSTSVALALGAVVDDLATTSFQIWGPEDDEDEPAQGG